MAEDTKTTGLTDKQRAAAQELTLLEMRKQAVLDEPDPKKRAKMIADLSRDYEGLRELYGSDLAFAQELIDTDVPTVREVGGIAVAPHWTEYLSQILRQGMGGYDRGVARKKLSDLSQQYQDSIAGVYESAVNRQNAQNQAQQQSDYMEQFKPPVRDPSDLSNLEYGMEEFGGTPPATPAETPAVDTAKQVAQANELRNGGGANINPAFTFAPLTVNAPTPPSKEDLATWEGNMRPTMTNLGMPKSTIGGKVIAPVAEQAAQQAAQQPQQRWQPSGTPTQGATLPTDRKRILNELMMRKPYPYY